MTSELLIPRIHTSAFTLHGFANVTAYMLKLAIPTARSPNFLRPHIALYFGTGILTCFPLDTLLSLSLGADSPYAV